MQDHRASTETGAEDGRCCDVPTRGEHGLDFVLTDQLTHSKTGADQTKQLNQFGEPASLQTTCLDGDQVVRLRNKACLQAIGHAKPADAPALRYCLSHSERWKQMPAGAAGGDEKPRHAAVIPMDAA